MSDHFSPTVVRATIPLSDVTPLELLLLQRAFTSERDGDGLYFYAEDRVTCEFKVPVAEIRNALSRSADKPTPTAKSIEADLKALEADASHLVVDCPPSAPMAQI